MHQGPHRLLTNPESWGEFSTGAVDLNIKPGKSVAKIQKSLFAVRYMISLT
jgi:hypothetical protein